MYKTPTLLHVLEVCGCACLSVCVYIDTRSIVYVWIGVYIHTIRLLFINLYIKRKYLATKCYYIVGIILLNRYFSNFFFVLIKLCWKSS